MIMLKKLSLQNALYATGFVFTTLYIYNIIDFATYANNRWGTFSLAFEDQLFFIYVLISPFVLGYHISEKNKVNSSPNNYTSLLAKIVRSIYLATIAVIAFAFSFALAVATNYEFRINNDRDFIQASVLGILTIVFLISSFTILKLAFKYK